MPLSIFTNCLNVAQLLIDVRELNITLIGGHLRPENASMVGGVAEKTLESLRFDHLFLGAGAIGEDCSIYSLDEQEARLNEKMLARSSHKTLLVDSNKFGRYLTYRVTSLSPEIHIVTDDGLDTAWRTRLGESGCPVTIVRSVGRTSDDEVETGAQVERTEQKAPLRP
jgi:DeoR family fructose operon transcriptional repressor